MISARSRLGFESRSRRDRVCASRPPKAVATYLTVCSGSCIHALRQESYWAARGVPNVGDGPWAMAQFRAISTTAAPQEWAPMRFLVRIVQTPGRVRGAHSLTGAACAPAMRVYRRGGAVVAAND